MDIEADGAPVAGGAAGAAGAADGGGSSTEQSVPYSRFKEVNDAKKQYESVLNNLGSDPDFEAFAKLKEEGKSLKDLLEGEASRMTAGSNGGTGAAPGASQDSLTRDAVREELERFRREIGGELEPIQRSYYQQAYERQVSDAAEQYAGVFDRQKHLDAVKDVQRRIPGLTVAEAFRLTDSFVESIRGGGAIARQASDNRSAVAESPGGAAAVPASEYASALKQAKESGDFTDVLKMHLAKSRER